MNFPLTEEWENGGFYLWKIHDLIFLIKKIYGESLIYNVVLVCTSNYTFKVTSKLYF